MTKSTVPLRTRDASTSANISLTCDLDNLRDALCAAMAARPVTLDALMREWPAPLQEVVRAHMTAGS